MYDCYVPTFTTGNEIRLTAPVEKKKNPKCLTVYPFTLPNAQITEKLPNRSSIHMSNI